MLDCLARGEATCLDFEFAADTVFYFIGIVPAVHVADVNLLLSIFLYQKPMLRDYPRLGVHGASPQRVCAQQLCGLSSIAISGDERAGGTANSAGVYTIFRIYDVLTGMHICRGCTHAQADGRSDSQPILCAATVDTEE